MGSTNENGLQQREVVDNGKAKDGDADSIANALFGWQLPTWCGQLSWLVFQLFTKSSL